MLYSLTGTTTISHVEHGEFHANEEGGFDLPQALADVLHSQHLNGKRVWETRAEKDAREAAEEDARRKDPATLLDAVEELVAQNKAAAVKSATTRRRSASPTAT